MSLPPDIALKTIDGEPATLGDFAGQALLIVNVASRCGFTPQYAGLEALHRRFRERGFAVLGFPCDQFGHQEPGDEGEIKQFCTDNYDVTFPMFAKIEVNGVERPSAVQGAEARGARPSRHAGDQVELHQVPGRPRAPRRAPLCAHRQARDARGGHRGRARLNAWPSASPPRACHVRQSPSRHRRFARHRPRLRVARRRERLVGRRQLSRRLQGGRRGRRDDRQEAAAGPSRSRATCRSKPMRSECSTPRRTRLGRLTAVIANAGIVAPAAQARRDERRAHAPHLRGQCARGLSHRPRGRAADVEIAPAAPADRSS